MYGEARTDMKKFLRAKSLVDAGLITKADAYKMLDINKYYYNKIISQLEREGESNEKK